MAKAKKMFRAYFVMYYQTKCSRFVILSVRIKKVMKYVDEYEENYLYKYQIS